MLAALSLPLASSALVQRVALRLGLSFHVASWALAATVIAALVLSVTGLLVARRGPDFRPVHWNLDVVLALVIACVSAALVVALLHRPDADDVIYLPKIVYAVAHPEVRMNGVIHEIAHTPALALPQSAAAYYPTAYEFCQAAFAHLTGVDLLWVYYRLAPSLAAIFGILLLAANLRLLGLSRRAAACAALILVPLILLLGESHRSFGNFTLLRLFQSKCAFIFLGLPMYIAQSMLFLRKPGIGRWLLLLAGVVAVSSMTTSALVMLPLLSLPLFLAWWFAFGREWPLAEGIARGAAYAATLSPALAFALDYRHYAIARVAYGSQINAGFPRTFSGQFHLVTGGTALSASIVMLLAALLFLGWRWREARHRFLLAWSVLTVACYLNPWVAPAIMRYLTTENIYWRLVFLIPLPLLVGAAAGALFDRPDKDAPSRHLAPFVLFAALAAAVVVSPWSVMRPGNHVTVSLTGYPLDTYADEARNCLRLANPGVMLAPVPLAQDMVVLSAEHPQVVTRGDFLRNALFAEPGDFAQRMSAAAFIAGTGGRLEDLVDVMQRLRPSTVIVARQALSTAMTAALTEQDLHPDGAVDHWIVYARSRSVPTQSQQP